jgi:hypothetical protein
MLNFKEWIVNESKFMQLDKDQQEDINLIADKMLEIAMTNSEEDYYKKILAGEIRRKDGRRPIPVYLKYEDINAFGEYNVNNDEITMNLRTIIKFKNKKLSGRQIPSIVNFLSHEAIHAIDPKFNPDIIEPRSAAEKAWNRQQFWSQGNKPSYYKSPAEFDAYGMGIVSNIRWKFNKSDKQGKNKVISGIENLLRTGDDDIIEVINKDDYVAMLHWKDKPKLWRKFQKRLFNLLQDLKSELLYDEYT